MFAGGRNEGWADRILRLAPRLPPPLRLAVARRAARRGLAVAALRAAPCDPVVFARIGAHLLAIAAAGGGRRGAAARSASLAATGRLEDARAQALAAAPLSRDEREFLAACAAPSDPSWALELLPPRASSRRAACALAAGRPDLAQSELKGARDGQEGRYLQAAVAAWRGEWRLARSRLNAAFVADGLSAPLAEGLDAPTTIDAFVARGGPSQAGGPLVSIVMAARNAATTLPGAVAAIVTQTWKALELIVVDDGSTDGTCEVAIDLARRDGRIRVLANTRAQGAYGARNTGIEAARGVFIAMHDADDWAHPQRIERQIAAIGRRQAASLCRYFRLDVEGRPMCPRTFPFVRMSPITVLARAETFRNLGPFEETSSGADSEWLARADERFGRRANARLSEAAYVALWRPGSLTHSAATSLFADEARRRLAYVGIWRARHAERKTGFASAATSD